jgi:hypothetical protein
MKFGHPDMHPHKLAGFAAAAKSKKTPKHLRAHQSRLAAATKSQGKMPKLMKPTLVDPQDGTEADVMEDMKTLKRQKRMGALYGM